MKRATIYSPYAIPLTLTLTLTHLLTGSRAPNGIRFGRNEGRGVDQSKKVVWSAEHSISTVSSVEHKCTTITGVWTVLEQIGAVPSESTSGKMGSITR